MKTACAAYYGQLVLSLLSIFNPWIWYCTFPLKEIKEHQLVHV
jgi:hypothetical protein